MNQFLDLLQTTSVVLPIFIACLLALIAAVLVIYYWPDENDHKFEREELQRSARQTQRMEQDGFTPVQTLEEFYRNYGEEEQSPRERMETLAKPAEAPRTAWMDELLAKYQFAMEFDADGNRARLTDQKYDALRNKEVGLDMNRVVGATYREFKTLLIHARSTINRRAQRAGFIPVKRRKVVSEVNAA